MNTPMDSFVIFDFLFEQQQVSQQILRCSLHGVKSNCNILKEHENILSMFLCMTLLSSLCAFWANWINYQNIFLWIGLGY